MNARGFEQRPQVSSVTVTLFLLILTLFVAFKLSPDCKLLWNIHRDLTYRLLSRIPRNRSLYAGEHSRTFTISTLRYELLISLCVL